MLHPRWAKVEGSPLFCTACHVCLAYGEPALWWASQHDAGGARSPVAREHELLHPTALWLLLLPSPCVACA